MGKEHLVIPTCMTPTETAGRVSGLPLLEGYESLGFPLGVLWQLQHRWGWGPCYHGAGVRLEVHCPQGSPLHHGVVLITAGSWLPMWFSLRPCQRGWVLVVQGALILAGQGQRLGSSCFICWQRWGWGCSHSLWCLTEVGRCYLTVSVILACTFPGPLKRDNTQQAFLRASFCFLSWISWLPASPTPNLGHMWQKETPGNSYHVNP